MRCQRCHQENHQQADVCLKCGRRIGPRSSQMTEGVGEALRALGIVGLVLAFLGGLWLLIDSFPGLFLSRWWGLALALGALVLVGGAVLGRQPGGGLKCGPLVAFGCFTVVLVTVVFVGCMNHDAQADPWISAAGHVWEGVTIYGGDHQPFGVVESEVTRDTEGEEAVLLRRPDGTLFHLKRNAIRSNPNYWLVRRDDPKLK